MARRGKKKGRPVSGWVILDKPVGMGSTEAVSKVKWLFQAEKAGHAGTLDPLASGMLPIALGEATKTVPYVQDGAKVYRFTVAWGEERSTDDLEGPVTKTSDTRPGEAEILALLPKYTGVIMQTPPQFSAIKIAGERAYDLARAGESVDIPEREVEIGRFDLVEMHAGRQDRVRDRMRQGHLCALARPRHGARPRLLRPHCRICAASRSIRSRRTISSPSANWKLARFGEAGQPEGEPSAGCGLRCDRRAAGRHRRGARMPAAGGDLRRGREQDQARQSGHHPRPRCAGRGRGGLRDRARAGWWRSARSRPACSSRSACLSAKAYEQPAKSSLTKMLLAFSSEFALYAPQHRAQA